MLRLRTMRQAYNEIHEKDPDSAVSFSFIRKSVVEGKCPALRSGAKWLVDMDKLEEFLKSELRGGV